MIRAENIYYTNVVIFLKLKAQELPWEKKKSIVKISM